MKIKLFAAKEKRNVEKTEDGRLSIDCMNCGNTPDIGSSECIRCVVKGISFSGEPERIILRTGKDTEYFGDAVTILNELAKTDSLAVAMCLNHKHSKKCVLCTYSQSKMIVSVWTAFPLPDLNSVLSSLNGFEPSDKMCEECVIQTYRSVEQLDHALKEVNEKAARLAFSLTEV